MYISNLNLYDWPIRIMFIILFYSITWIIIAKFRAYYGLNSQLSQYSSDTSYYLVRCIQNIIMSYMRL